MQGRTCGTLLRVSLIGRCVDFVGAEGSMLVSGSRSVSETKRVDEIGIGSGSE